MSRIQGYGCLVPHLAKPNSYGFRPGRSCHDAIDAIYISINQKPKYVLDADIEKCFDRISHTALLAKLQTFPFLRRVIKGWLKAGVIENGAWFPTEEGTPQGGVCSPLLANIALHGLEQAITSAFPALVQNERWKPTVVRYADDLVVLHSDKAVIEQVQQLVSTWLAGMGLALKPSKTCITHTGRTTTLQSAQSAVLRGWTRICSKCSGNGATNAILTNQPNGERKRIGIQSRESGNLLAKIVRSDFAG